MTTVDNTEIHYLAYDPEEIWTEMAMTYIDAGGDVYTQAMRRRCFYAAYRP